MDLSTQLIDLALHRKPIFRHLFFNLDQEQRKKNLSHLARLIPAFIFLDSFSNWSFQSLDRWSVGSAVSQFFYIDDQHSSNHIQLLTTTTLRYFLLLILLSLSTALFLWPQQNDELLKLPTHRIGDRLLQRIFRTLELLLVASLGKLLTVLILIWPFPTFIGRTIDLIVMTTQITAISGLWRVFVCLKKPLTSFSPFFGSKAVCSCSSVIPLSFMLLSYHAINYISAQFVFWL